MLISGNGLLPDREFARYGIGTQLVVQKIACLLRLTWVAS